MGNFTNLNKNIDNYMKKHKLLAAIILIIVFVISSAGTYMFLEKIDSKENTTDNYIEEQLPEETDEFILDDTSLVKEEMEEIINAQH